MNTVAKTDNSSARGLATADARADAPPSLTLRRSLPLRRSLTTKSRALIRRTGEHFEAKSAGQKILSRELCAVIDAKSAGQRILSGELCDILNNKKDQPPQNALVCRGKLTRARERVRRRLSVFGA